MYYRNIYYIYILRTMCKYIAIHFKTIFLLYIFILFMLYLYYYICLYYYRYLNFMSSRICSWVVAGELLKFCHQQLPHLLEHLTLFCWGILNSIKADTISSLFVNLRANTVSWTHWVKRFTELNSLTLLLQII